MISERLIKIILDELNLDDYEINDETLAQQVPGWDSLNHINVILAVEKNIKFVLKPKNCSV